MSLEYTDLLIIGAYFVLIFLIAVYFSRRKGSAAEYFLAGRGVGWAAVGASLFATNISSEHFIGEAGAGYGSGIAVNNYDLIGALTTLLLAYVFGPFYIRSKVFTMPEFIERRYNSASRWYLTAVSLVAYILTKVSVTLLAGGLLLHTVLGWDIFTSSVVLILATGVYTIFGGLSAVIYTEAIQTVVLVVSALALLVIGLLEIGDLNRLFTEVPENHWSLLKPLSDPNFPWTGVLFGIPIVATWYHCTDQYMVQRFLSAKNLGHAKAGSIFSGYLKILPVFILLMPGIVARVLYPDIRPDDAYPMLVSRLLPTGLKGVVIAGFLAALMSSLASCFNSCSTLFTFDVYQKLQPNASEKKLVTVGRLVTVVIVGLSLLWVPFIHTISDQLYIYLQSISAYVAPPITAVFLLGIVWTRANGKAALATLLGGFFFGVIRFVSELLVKSGRLTGGLFYELGSINFLHYAILLFVLSLAVMAVVSLATAAPERAKVDGLTYSYARIGEDEEEETPATKRRNAIATFILILIIISFYVVFN